MLNKVTTLALAAVVTLAGCSGTSKTGGQTAGGGAAASKRPRDGFESRRDPGITPETRFAAGQLAEEHGALSRAAHQYENALKLDPNHLKSLYRLGVVYAGQKKYPDAIEIWKRYVRASKEAPEAYSNLGFCYELAGHPEDAEAAYLKGIRRDARNQPCRVNYGLMLVRLGRVGEGKMQLQAVLQPAEVHYNVGSVYEALGRREQAKSEYRQALSLDPALADAQTRLAELDGSGRPTTQPAETGITKTE
ncbi:MAG TPA: tetratricopeptide repeat protein [Tepidisphaeraceae bacterium]|nr:tetratricopeptide repeat protein [Tepidisphaeraceae bacterium]